MEIKIIYTETIKQVLAIILIPLFYMGILLGIIFSINLDALSDAVETLLVLGGVIISMLASVVTIFSFIMEAGTASYDDDGVKINLFRNNPLFPFRGLTIPFTGISNVSYEIDPGKGAFISIKTRSPKKSMMIFPEGYHESDDFSAFWEGLQAIITIKNAGQGGLPGKIITTKGFFDNPIMRILAHATVAAAMVFTFLYWQKPETVSGGKLIAFYCYAIPFCYLVLGRKR